MSIFAIVVTSENDDTRAMMREVVAEKFPEQHMNVDDCLWFVESQLATAQELFNVLDGGNDEQNLNSYIIFPVSSYYGRHKMPVWEWLRAKGL